MTNAESPSDPGYLCARCHPCWGTEAALFTKLIHAGNRCLIRAANFLELYIVLEGQIGPGALATEGCRVLKPSIRQKIDFQLPF
jgi:hypothetical protein